MVGRAAGRGPGDRLRRVVALPGAPGRDDGLGIDPGRGALDHALPGLLEGFGTRRATILENNIVQTAGSAGESIAFGVGVTMPALMILGYDMELAHVMLVAGPRRPARHPDDDPAASGVHRPASTGADVPRGDRLRQGPDRRRAGGRQRPDGLRRLRPGGGLSVPDAGDAALERRARAGRSAGSRGRSSRARSRRPCWASATSSARGSPASWSAAASSRPWCSRRRSPIRRGRDRADRPGDASRSRR